MKNYESEIEQFLKEVLPFIISDSEHIEYLYEEDYEGTLYEFKEGKIVESGKVVEY
ncbi:hypothetical protein [Lysinibacillus sp. BPa_S21]|uniref:hypothetical protein n=1 Tax=Lysinibacillus sp. BPa_S21 TaxID=2932478 RepID=UPI00201289C0|nr:hypothetical protein [Lysinibacillus sp. BPa_S21]MCL1696321.1 hypothetical protein [Lysinibacillus sp. BPa_S21]